MPAGAYLFVVMHQRFRKKAGEGRRISFQNTLPYVQLCSLRPKNRNSKKLDNLGLHHKTVFRILDNTAELCVLFFWQFTLFEVTGKALEKTSLTWVLKDAGASGCISVTRSVQRHDG